MTKNKTLSNRWYYGQKAELISDCGQLREVLTHPETGHAARKFLMCTSILNANETKSKSAMKLGISRNVPGQKSKPLPGYHP